MRPSPAVHALAAGLLLAVRTISGQNDTTRVVTAAPARWHAQATLSYSEADNGYGAWRGYDMRLLYSGKSFSPFVNVGTQSRQNGSQTAVGVGSYINITPWMFSIVGVGIAPDNGVVLFPKLRSDASLFVAVPGVKGVLASVGVTDLRFTDPRTGGRIFSLGSIVYHGPGIYSAAVRLNADRASGAQSSSWQAGAQWGAQGKYWVGLGVSAGNEAYQVLSAVPFDARFRSQSAQLFASKWVTANSGIGLRYDYEHKIDVYHRNGLSLSYFVDF